MNFSSPLFWYRLIFLLELLISETLFVIKLKKRNHFLIRLFSSLILIFLLVFFFPLRFYNAYYVSMMFLYIFLLTVFGLWFCFDCQFTSILFCAIAGYAVQHIAYEIDTGFTTALGLDLGNSPYEETGEFAVNVITASIYFESYLATYLVSYLFFGRKIKKDVDLVINHLSLMFLSGIIVLVAVFFNALLTYQKTDAVNLLLTTLIHILNMISCVLALLVLFFSLDNRKMRNEIDTLQKINEEQKRHYMLFKENVDYINIKCHDLKHQIRNLTLQSDAKKQVIEEIENAVNIYDSDVKTGNDTLDVILTEKRILCAKKKISFSYIADGTRLRILSEADICSLFGNALDNAIEACDEIKEWEKRSIGMNIKESRGFLSISIRNTYDGEILFSGMDPQTRKKDRRNHGFGIKSIRNIVNRYHGEMSMDTENNIFTLNILLPIAES